MPCVERFLDVLHIWGLKCPRWERADSHRGRQSTSDHDALITVPSDLRGGCMSLPTASCRGSARNPLPPFSGLRCRGLTLVLLLCLLGGGSAVFAAGPTTTTTTTAATLAPPSSGTSAARLYTDENYRPDRRCSTSEVVPVRTPVSSPSAPEDIRLGSLPASAENLSLGQARSLLTSRLQVYVKTAGGLSVNGSPPPAPSTSPVM